jgi:release factor glutamine methyltransferase
MKFKEIEFKPKNGKKMTLFSSKGVFSPNTTTDLLISAVKKTVTEPKKTLDLGCGTGIVGLSLFLEGLAKEPLFASDFSEQAVLSSKENFKIYGCDAEVLCGSLFEPWEGKKFEVIIDDISGISQELAKISPWFEGVPCETGRDGTDLVLTIINNSSRYLLDDGYFFFPVLSLSNVGNILKRARESFYSVELIERQEWPLPKELEAHKTLLKELSKNSSIALEERFGMFLCYTEIYLARNPIN